MKKALQTSIISFIHFFLEIYKELKILLINLINKQLQK